MTGGAVMFTASLKPATDAAPASAAPEWPGSRPLTVGQEMHVDYLLSTETNILVREALIGIKREGMPSEAYVGDFVSHVAEWGRDDLASALALQILETARDSDRDETVAQAESSNDTAKAFALEDVRQFIEFDLATQTFDDADVAHYEKMLNKVFDYEIVFEGIYGCSPAAILKKAC